MVHRLQLAQRDQVKTRFILSSIIGSMDPRQGKAESEAGTRGNNELLETLCTVLNGRLRQCGKRLLGN